MTQKGMLSWYFETSLLMRISIALSAGVACGITLDYFPEAAKVFITYTALFGDIFIRLLKMIVLPVVLFSLVVGAASISPSRLGRVGGRVILLYMLTSACAVVVGLGFASLFQPGSGLSGLGSNGAATGQMAAVVPLSQILLNVIPTNIFESLAKGDILPIILFAILFGLSLSIIKHSENAAAAKGADTLLQIVTAAADVMYKIVRGVMEYAPIGVFFLIAIVFAQQGASALGPLLVVSGTFYLALLFLLLFVYGGLLGLFRLNLFTFLKGTNKAIITAFVTRSSSGTLPVSMQVSEENLGVPRSISSFSLPLGATINMNGTAIYLGVCAVFITNAIGAPLTLDQQLTIIMTATLAAIGTAGVPGAGALMLLMVLESIGMRLEGGSAVAAAYAMILGIDAILDMGRSALNVGGDILVSTIVSKQEGELDLTKWKK